MQDIEGLFAEHKVCWGPYQSVREMLQNTANCSPENPMFVRQLQPQVGEILMAGTPLDFESVERQQIDTPQSANLAITWGSKTSRALSSGASGMRWLTISTL